MPSGNLIKTDSDSPRTGRFSVFGYNFDTAGRGPVLLGTLLFIPLLIALGAWAALAPLNAAAIANGEVVLNFDRKTIQHLEGGIVDEIFVSEGEAVARGELLISIRDLPQRTQINTLIDQLVNARARYSRLWAEHQDHRAPDFSEIGEGVDLDPEKRETIVAVQEKLFQSRRAALQSQTDILHSSQAGARKEIDGLRLQLAALRKQRDLVVKELEGVSELQEKGLTTLSRKLDLEKLKADREGEIGVVLSDIGRLEQTILAADLKILDAKIEMQKSVLDELQETGLVIQEMTYKLVAIRDQLKRTVIKTPVAGRILDLQVHTKGAVLSPGQKILDIVPHDDRLIIEARLNPNDIDLVSHGTRTKVLLSAYKAKKVPKLDGTVETVSGDILADPATGERYFLARVVVDRSVLKTLKADVDLYPGMPVQVFFVEGERTFADYLLSPIFDATYRAFREE